MFFKRTDNLTNHLTSYDFLKFATLIFMLIDHVGAFFMVDELWFRVLGRLGFPAWFFLAGYSKGREINQTLWLGAGMLVLGNIVLGQYLLPLNALCSFILVRLLMSSQYQKLFSNWETLLYVTMAMILMAYPTGLLFEYGTLVFMMGMFGYVVRHKDELEIGKIVRILFCSVTVLAITFFEIVTFGFNPQQSLFCLITLSALCVLLYHFKSLEYPHLTQKLPRVLVSILQFGGRYTLEIYVFHLLAIKAYLLYADYGHYHWFSPTLFPNFPTN